ncbi:MAG: ABC transporter permease subunit [Deltaproteobacteria bacterium]|nr:ABC transporter permease subunit [Deltaproteobacteria bacterium]
MRNTLAIARKELNVYFTTPMAYAAFCFVTVLGSYIFIYCVQGFSRASLMAMQGFYDSTRINLTDLVLTPTLTNLGVLVGFVAPFVTMRLLAEEKRQHTMELLMTTPVRPTEIVLGKFFAAWSVVVVSIGFTFIYPVVLQVYGASAGSTAPIEWATVATGYAGLLLWGGAVVAIGLFVSSRTENQAVAAVIGLAVTFGLWLIAGAASGTTDELAKQIFGDLGWIPHIASMASGSVSTKDIAYFISLMVLALFLTQRTVEAQRWS